MLLIRRRGGNFRGDILDQFVGVHHAVFIGVRRAFHSLHDEITEHAVAAAELWTFKRNLARAAGQQTEKVALRVAQMADVGVHRGVLDRTDFPSFANIGEQQHSVATRFN